MSYEIDRLVVSVKDYGALGNGVTDDLSAINAAIAKVNQDGGILYFPPGTFKVSNTLTAITRAGVKITGSGKESTVIASSSATANVLVINNYNVSVEDISFRPSVFQTAGYAISLETASWACLNNLFFEFHANAILNKDSSSCFLENVVIRSISGDRGINFCGSLIGGGSFGFYMSRMICDNPYPYSAPSANDAKGNLANSTVYAAGNVVISNDWIWQCTIGGTSAANAASVGLTVPTSSASAWATTNVSSGTASFKAVCKTSHIWILQDSYSNSLAGSSIALLNGGYGFFMNDGAATGTSYPNWSYFWDLEIDHPYYAGLNASAGLGIHATSCWIGSCVNGNGVLLNSNYKGETALTDCRILGNAEHGILVNAGKNFLCNGCMLANNGVKTTNTYNGVAVADNMTEFQIVNNSTGYIVPFSSSDQAYGISIGSGCDYFVVTGNVGRGNVSGSVLNGAGTSGTQIVSNNV